MLPYSLALALALAAHVVEHPLDDFGDTLVGTENAVTSCRVETRIDGPHLLIAMSRSGVGNAICIVAEDDHGAAFDYAFPTRGKSTHPVLQRPSLEQARSVDIPTATARGMQGEAIGNIISRTAATRCTSAGASGPMTRRRSMGLVWCGSMGRESRRRQRRPAASADADPRRIAP